MTCDNADKAAVEPEKDKAMDEEKEDSEFEIITEEEKTEEEKTEKTTTPNIYPTLPAEDQSRLWKASLNQQGDTQENKKNGNNAGAPKEPEGGEEEDPNVAAALVTMKAMGFTDDGGWLSSLLRAKSGAMSSM